MTYEIELKPRAFKDLQSLPKSTQRRIVAKIEGMAEDLAGDVKRLTNFTPGIGCGWATIEFYSKSKETRPSCIASCIEKMRIVELGDSKLKLHPEILEKNGEKQFAVLPYDEFLALQELLADAEDVLELRKAKRAEGKKKSIPLADVKKKLGLRYRRI